jgi:hypothetical protein
MRSAAFVAVLLAIAGVVASEPALAHGRARVSVGVGFGFGYPYWGGPWGPYYPYYYPPTVVVQQPVTYVEQSSSAAPPAPAADAGWWYYCDQSRGYYPYVRECPAGWQRVAPVPAPK